MVCQGLRGSDRSRSRCFLLDDHMVYHKDLFLVAVVASGNLRASTLHECLLLNNATFVIRFVDKHRVESVSVVQVQYLHRSCWRLKGLCVVFHR